MQFEKLEGVEFFVSKSDRHKIYAEYLVENEDGRTPGVRKFVDIDSPDFASFLRLIAIPKMHDPMSVSEIIRYVRDYCRVYGNRDTITANVRIAGKLADGLVEYSLYNEEQEYVQITPNGWTITKDPSHKFIETENAYPQCKPKKSSKKLPSLFKKYVNAKKCFVIILLVWLIQSFCEGNHSALLIMAQRGSGKSTLTKQLRQIIDPSKLDATTKNNKTENLLTALTNSYVVAFDNVCDLTKADSNALCVAITGGTYSKRELYTTNQLAIFKLHNTVIINGINIIPTESDFAERSLLVQLKKIDETTRINDDDISKNFNDDLPYILGGIFDVISEAMTIVKTLKPTRKPRMAESYTEMLAIAMALGIDEKVFEDVYFDNIHLIDKARSNTDLVFAVREFMEKCVKGRSFEGSVSEVYAKVRANYSGNKSALPRSASAFSQKVKADYSSFLAAGYVVNVDDTRPEGTYIKLIRKK